MRSIFQRCIPCLILIVLCGLLGGVGCTLVEGKSNRGVYRLDTEVKIHVNRNQLRVGEPVTVTLTITNIGDRVQIIESADTPVFDINIVGVGSSQVSAAWSLEHPDLVVHRLELQPGESKTVEFTWTLTPERALPGTVVGVGGFLYQDSKNVKDVGVLLCVNYC